MKTKRFALALLPAVLALAQDLVIRTKVRLVDVYATVLDGSGKPVDGITRDRFQVFDNGNPEPIQTFESVAGEISCALLLDTTGSMRDSLAGLKNGVGQLLDEMRPNDSAAIYSFTTSLVKLQDFTTDKEAARRAAQRLHAQGATALYDAIAQVAGEVADRPGKKAIILFTDGADNASSLMADAASKRAYSAGIPIYSIAEGDALSDHKLMERLQMLAEKTGGVCHKARSAKDVAKLFAEIDSELQHLYMLSYKPPQNSDETRFRTIEVRVSGKGLHVRGKTGYFPN